MNERSKRRVSGGYLRTSLFLNKIFNIVLACILILLCSPLLLCIYLFVLLCAGRPAIYRGTRLGLHKKPFTMYKFRTLVRDADKIIGPQLLTSRHKLVLPFGKFFRDTRLDELPQLFNVLRGNMDFVGPRPIRPEIYEHICRHIPNYDRRFTVNPGLIGFAQLFTPHNAPKKIRAMIDNILIKKKQKILWDALIIGLAGAVVTKATIWRLCKNISEFFRSRVLRLYSEKRELERIAHRSAQVFVGDDAHAESLHYAGSLIDINEQAFLMCCKEKIPRPFPKYVRLNTELKRARGSKKKKTAVCEAEQHREFKRDNGEYYYVMVYTPISPLNFYRVHQYFLSESLA